MSEQDASDVVNLLQESLLDAFTSASGVVGDYYGSVGHDTPRGKGGAMTTTKMVCYSMNSIYICSQYLSNSDCTGEVTGA